MLFHLISTCALLAPSSDLATQSTRARAPSVELLQGSASPGPRRAHSLVYDEARARVVLFGGAIGGPALEPTWTWDGQAWTAHAIDGPSSRRESACAFDVVRGRIVLYGGRIGDFTVLDQTWQLDGRTWSRALTPQPGARVHFAAAYDRARERFVVVGGFRISTGSDLTDVWEWNGAAWTRLQATAPIALFAPQMAFDEASKRLVLTSTRPSDLKLLSWTFDGTKFVQVGGDGPALIPMGQALTTLGPDGGLLLFGGRNANAFVRETWRWQSGAWTLVDVEGPSARGNAALTYDRARDRVLLYGGEDSRTAFDDLWEFAGGAWKELR